MFINLEPDIRKRIYCILHLDDYHSEDTREEEETQQYFSDLYEKADNISRIKQPFTIKALLFILSFSK